MSVRKPDPQDVNLRNQRGWRELAAYFAGKTPPSEEDPDRRGLGRGLHGLSPRAAAHAAPVLIWPELALAERADGLLE